MKGENLSEEINTKLIQQAYQSIKAGDIPSFFNLLAENVLWIVPELTNVPFAGTWEGREQAGQFFSRMVEVQDVIEFEPEEFIAQHDNVVVLGHFTMYVRLRVELPAPIGYTFGKWKASAEPIAQHR
jgi:ketosteroid isomerase-like protein